MFELFLPERGTFIPGIERRRPRTARTVQQEQRILAHVAANPGTIARRISSAEGVHRSTVSKILHKDRLYPYHLQRVQGLNPEDLPRRVRFCQWCLEQCVRHPQFLCNLLFTDEVMFTRDGIFNFHNVHIWAHANPRHSRGKTSDHIPNKCLGWYLWGSVDWSSPFTRAADGANARHLA